MLPQLSEAASSEVLKAAFQEHLKVTEKQVARLDRIFRQLDRRPTKMSHGMIGLAKESQRVFADYEKSAVLDAAMAAVARKIEHYEISGYGSARTLAEMLGNESAAALLQQTIEEEEEADQILAEAAESIVAGNEEEVVYEE